MARTSARARATQAIGATESDDEPPKVDLDLSPECRAVVDVLRGHLRAGRDPAELAAQILLELATVPGPIEQQVRADVAALGVLDGARGTYARVAYRLARALDAEGEDGATGLAGAAREMRAALDKIWSGVKHARPGDTAAADLGKPV